MPISQIYFGMKIYMFRTVRLSIIRSLFTVHSTMVYVIQVCRHLSSRTVYIFRRVRLSIIRSLFTVHSAMVCVIQVCRLLWSRTVRSCSKAVYKPVWHKTLLSVQWINSWWRTDELSETCRVSCQNKFVKLVHLVGFIIKKLVTMHGHMNVKYGLKDSTRALLPFQQYHVNQPPAHLTSKYFR